MNQPLTIRCSAPQPEAPTTTPSRSSGAWLSVEGVNGVGKTHLVSQTAARMGPRCTPIAELPETSHDSLTQEALASLTSRGDPFLRTGHPVTETLVLVALAVRRYETTRLRLEPGRIMLEDRGPDSVAVYQAAILAADDDDDYAYGLVQRTLATIAAWRPLPERTLLLVDDPDRCRERYERRVGRASRPDDLEIMTRAAGLYARLADDESDRVQVIDRRGMSEDEATETVLGACLEVALLANGAVAPQGEVTSCTGP